MRRGQRVAAGVGLVVALAVIGAGCGRGTSTSSDTSSATSTTGDGSTTVATTDDSFNVLAGEGVPVDLDDLATNLSDRLVAAGYADATVEVAGDRVTVTPGDGPLDPATLEVAE